MREILFKAKRKDNGEWIEGSLIDLDIDSGYCYIVPPYKQASTLPISFLITDGMKLVDPETLCQFTGLCDKNGNKIWENDILKTRSDEYAQVKFGFYGTGFASGDYNQGFYAAFPEDFYYRHELGYWCKETYVRGNIFDNPELLQEEPNE
ncbi:MAG: hypothetical protein DBX48_03705 [Limosilactobacillus fermentum]|nr:MAG: hypothetical protein DBX48_03390 [Limosilactobacillus fermentum]PWM27526.1 MAG: hypothetical protein DBX48_03705 [Limosilactobacillus fermentum]